MLKKIARIAERCTQSHEKWQKSFADIHGEIAERGPRPDTLRFILGNGRSGTSWFARVMSQSATPLRYCHEIITYARPAYYFSRTYDYVACPYRTELADDDPLVLYYALTTHPDLNWQSFLGARYPRQVRRDDDNFTYALHKEVHALLATEGLVKKFQCPTIVITRNPLYNIDSLFSYQDISSIIWRNEAQYIKDPLFLQNYFPDNGDKIIEQLEKHPDNGFNRHDVLVSKTITVAVINAMLRQLGDRSPWVSHVAYERLCDNPLDIFHECAVFLGLRFDDQTRTLLAETMMKQDDRLDPMSVHRDTKMQQSRPFRFLTPEEARVLQSILEYTGLF
ncbi:MAG: hypothetical protein ACOY32_06950 [Thermodesulfobacteriota bacterium]